METLLGGAVVDDHIEAARQSYDEFVLAFECVSVSHHTAGHIVNPVGTTYIEGNVA